MGNNNLYCIAIKKVGEERFLSEDVLIPIVNKAIVISDEILSPRIKNDGEIFEIEILCNADLKHIFIQNCTLSKRIRIDMKDRGEYVLDGLMIQKECLSSVRIYNLSVKDVSIDCKEFVIEHCKIEVFNTGLNDYIEAYESDDKNNLSKVDNFSFSFCEINECSIMSQCKEGRIVFSSINKLKGGVHFILKSEPSIGELYILSTYICNININGVINKISVYNTAIDEIELEGWVQKTRIELDDVNIKSKFKIHSNARVQLINENNNFVERTCGFSEENFIEDDNYTEDDVYLKWLLLGKSAEYTRNTNLKNKAYYNIAKLSYKDSKKFGIKIGAIMDWCNGYGYKPLRVVYTSFIYIIFNAVVFSIIDFVRTFSKMQLSLVYVKRVLRGIASNLLFSTLSFIGKANIDFSNWGIETLRNTFSLIESVSGILLFAILVNALYVKYK